MVPKHRPGSAPLAGNSKHADRFKQLPRRSALRVDHITTGGLWRSKGGKAAQPEGGKAAQPELRDFSAPRVRSAESADRRAILIASTFIRSSNCAALLFGVSTGQQPRDGVDRLGQAAESGFGL